MNEASEHSKDVEPMMIPFHVEMINRIREYAEIYSTTKIHFPLIVDVVKFKNSESVDYTSIADKAKNLMNKSYKEWSKDDVVFWARHISKLGEDIVFKIE